MNASQLTSSPNVQDLSAESMERIDINGRKMAFYRTGLKSPTVILETGVGAESDEWSPIQRSLGAISSVFRYDRPGRGASDAAVAPGRSAGTMVGELHALLHCVQIPGPYILVGHSFGGLLMRLYAHRYPDEVAGLLLVDSMHEDQFEVFGSTFPPPTPDDPQALRSMREFWTGGWRDPKSTPEGIDFIASIREAREIRSLGNLPVHVITAGTFTNNALVSEHVRPKLQSLWSKLQRQFLSLSPAATHSYASKSGHFVQRDSPEVVTDAISGLIARMTSPKFLLSARLPANVN